MMNVNAMEDMNVLIIIIIIIILEIILKKEDRSQAHYESMCITK